MASKYEMSKTYQYRKVMKPLLERKRRARINKCLDDLKDIMADCLAQQSGDPNVKFEKADILELTVQHLRKLKVQRQQQKHNHSNNCQQSFRNGYIQAANEVSRCLATLPKVDVALGTQLMTHLGMRLNQLESVQEINASVNTPLSIVCGAGGRIQPSSALYSPVSSGYASDSDCSSASSTGSASPAVNKGLLQITAAPAAASSMWRPW